MTKFSFNAVLIRLERLCCWMAECRRYLLATVVVALCSVRATKKWSLAIGASIVLSFVFFFPGWYPLVRYIHEFVTSLTGLLYISGGDRLGWHGTIVVIGRGLVHHYLFASLSGLVLILLSIRALCEKGLGFLVVAFLVSTSFVIWAGVLFCPLDGLSGICFARHFSRWNLFFWGPVCVPGYR
jgi:hypothetical protein